MSHRRIAVVDIETGPLPADMLKKLEPEFKPDPRLKDFAKIEASIEEKRRAWLEGAALSAVTGRVLCVGILEGGQPVFIADADESKLLANWWTWYAKALADRKDQTLAIIGHNLKAFDIPFLVRRSWILGVKPGPVMDGRYLAGHFIDTMEAWQLGDRHCGEPCGLGAVARALGVGDKTGSGADFAKLWASDRPKALEYLCNDLKLTAAVAERLGIA